VLTRRCTFVEQFPFLVSDAYSLQMTRYTRTRHNVRKKGQGHRPLHKRCKATKKCLINIIFSTDFDILIICLSKTI